MSTLIVNSRSTAKDRCAYGCCQLHRPTARCSRGRKAERRALKRRERQVVRREIDAASQP